MPSIEDRPAAFATPMGCLYPNCHCQMDQIAHVINGQTGRLNIVACPVSRDMVTEPIRGAIVEVLPHDFGDNPVQQLDPGIYSNCAGCDSHSRCKITGYCHNALRPDEPIHIAVVHHDKPMTDEEVDRMRAINYAELPQTIGDIRSNKSHDSGDWTPRDALLKCLAQIDSGERKIDELVIAYATAKTDSDKFHAVGYWNATRTTHVALGLLADVSFSLAYDSKFGKA